MTTANLKRARQAFTAILGQDCVLDEGTAQAHYGTDTTGARRRLAGALRPATGDAIAPIVEVARMQGVALHPISTGRNWGYGTALAVLDDVFILDLSQLKRILDFDAELGTVTVEPGVTQGMLAEYLDQHAPEFLVPVTGAGPGASLMGNALERGFGFTRNSDHASAILSLEAVLPDGRVYRSAMAEMGGSRVDRLYRWGIGPYFEGLFAQNGFGIVTQVTLALARRPAAYGSLLFFVEDDQLEAAVQACREILSTLPGIVPSMKFMNETMVMASTIPYPHHLVAPGDVMPPTLRSSLSRSASIPPWSGYITLYGTHATVKAARREIRRQLKR
ncbi:MAG: FAD-binding oxidoreductase, partial [Betaproteobacteria bacterium]